MNMLEILETNRRINTELEEEKKRYRLEVLEIKKRHQERVKNHTEFINENLHFNNELGVALMNHSKLLDSIKSEKSYGNIIISFNNVIFYDLATMQMLDPKKVYKMDSNGNKVIKDGLVVIDQNIDSDICEEFAKKAAQNIFYLRELAYYYFKTYGGTSSEEFKEIIDFITKDSIEKLLKATDIKVLYEFLTQIKEIEQENLDNHINTIFSATKKVFRKKRNKGLL